jgi:hypothetical protein
MQLTDGTGSLKLSTSKDYVLKLAADKPVYLPKGLDITGGRNVVVIGGQVDVRNGYTASNGEATRRGMYLKGQTGTVYIEGVRFSSTTTGTLTEGIDLDERLGAQVVLQNVRVDHLKGSYATNHADGLQTWAGPRKLLIDGLSIDTDYQGMFLLPNQHFTGPAPELFDLRNISITGEPGSGYLLWKDSQDFPVKVTNVEVKPGSHNPTDRGAYLWPKNNPVWGNVTAATQPTQTATTAGVSYLAGQTAPVQTAPVDTAPVQTAPVDTAPVQTAPVDTAPVQTGGTSTSGTSTSGTSTSGTSGSSTGSTAGAVVYRINAGGAAIAGSPGWAADKKSAPSPYTNASAAYSTTSSSGNTISLANRSVPAGTPASLFQSQRYDVSKADDMQWDFPVANGTYTVRLYFAETYSGCWKVGGRVFDVYANGTLALKHQDVYAEAGKNAGLVKTITVQAKGGHINLEFKAITQNPLVQGIEILKAS